MKFIKIILFISIFSIPVYITVKSMTKNEDKNWQTYYKSKEGVNVHRSTNKEKRKARIVSTQIKKKSKRTPASIPRPKDKKTNREILGRITKDTVFINKPNTDWKKLYARDLLSKFGEETKVLIKKNNGIVRIIANKATYIEQVQVTVYQGDNTPPNSFEAQVDAQTGKQLSVWNKTTFENTKNDFRMKKRLGQ